MVAPYAVTFYVTHKCNLDCSYCTQKEPDVFSAELPTAEKSRLTATLADALLRAVGVGVLDQRLEALQAVLLARKEKGG